MILKTAARIVQQWLDTHTLRRGNTATHGGWASLLYDDGQVHVIPLRDLIPHEPSEECLCGPATAPVNHQDGTIGWLVIHHSLDNREALERAHA